MVPMARWLCDKILLGVCNAIALKELRVLDLGGCSLKFKDVELDFVVPTFT